MRENVTVIFKSFERQKMAKRLYENLQKYYPGVRVVIADDSRKPLDLQGDSLTIIHLSFNSGLSYGLNQALERVDTPYVEYSCAVTPQVRQTGNRLSGLAGTAYASLLT